MGKPADCVVKHRSGNSILEDCTERIRSIESSANSNLALVASSAHFLMIPGCILPNLRSGILNDFDSPATLLASLDKFIAEQFTAIWRDHFVLSRPIARWRLLLLSQAIFN
jgi:hypothetical protein